MAAVPGVSGTIDEYAYDLGASLQQARADGILVLDTATGDCYLAAGQDYPMTDSQITSYMNQYLYADAMEGNYGDGVLALFDGINQFYVAEYGLGYLDGGAGSGGGVPTAAVGLILLLIAALVVFSLIDSIRYSAYRSRYFGVVDPPVVFRPILFWHAPGTRWYRRHWRRPPPPPPPRGPGPGPGGGFTGFHGPAGAAFPAGPGAEASPAAPGEAASPAGAAAASAGAAGFPAAAAAGSGAAGAAASAGAERSGGHTPPLPRIGWKQQTIGVLFPCTATGTKIRSTCGAGSQRSPASPISTTTPPTACSPWRCAACPGRRTASP